ncbi:MAG: hypothetical protein V3U24_09890 [Candidatus Neomarinimicrobiota bacterium]
MTCRKIFALLLLTATVAAPAAEREWSTGTAHTLPRGRYEIGLFQPLRYGQTEYVEWSTHPILFIKMPNIRVKISHSTFSGWKVATRHSLVYPTPLLRLLRVKGFGIQALADMDVGGIISDDPTIPQIPHMISSRNEIMLTRFFGTSTFITVKAGLALSVKSGELDSRTSVDLPTVFPRLGVYHNTYGMNLGLDFLTKVTKRTELVTDMDALLLPGLDEGTFAFEHKGLLIWNKSSRFQVTVGYKLVFGEYPFGTQWHLLPLFDLQWGWSK